MARRATSLRRAVDIAVGLTLLFSVSLAFVRDRLSADLSLLVVGLHVLIAVLFLLRTAPRREGTWLQQGLCFVSVPMAMLVFVWAPPLSQWPLAALALFVIGGLATAASLATLGRSFAILPAVRTVVVRGPYDLVRHPAYAGELFMVAACVLAAPKLLPSLMALAAVAWVVLRIRMEEALLRAEPLYSEYCTRVRYRLLPLLW